MASDSLSTQPTRRMIILLGIMQRSGTNFLAHLIDLHPEVALHSVVHEDWLLYHADHLMRFAETVARRWHTSGWRIPGQATDNLLTALGNGLTGYLISLTSSNHKVLMKTPSIWNISLASRLFPDAQVVVIVRDGRDLVTSGMRTFGWKFEEAVRRYHDAAQLLRQAMSRDDRHPFFLVRYEDLLNDQVKLQEILAFLELDIDAYNFDAVKRLPIYGSSGQGTLQGEENYWKPISKADDFKPVGRWSTWSVPQKERFKWLAGEDLVHFGYETKEYLETALIWRLYNYILSFWYNLKRKVRFLSKVLRRLWK